MPNHLTTRPDTIDLDLDLSSTQAHLVVDRAMVTQILSKVCLHEMRDTAQISVILVDNAAIRDINARYLGHDWATDVISFPDEEISASHLIGELVVSAELAVQMAAQSQCEPLHELSLYLVHGLLHLCGHDDHSAAEKAEMRRRETAILRDLGIDSPYERTAVDPVLSDDSGRESVCWPR